MTGTIFEQGEEPPSYRGAPEPNAPYVWVCDAFYEVDSGGSKLELADRTVRVAFESPSPRGFTDREAAISAAKRHLRTQFARLGVPGQSVSIDVIDADAEPARS